MRNCGLGAKDDARGDLDHAAALAPLDDLGVAQMLGRAQPRLAWPSRFAGAREFLFDSVDLQQRIVIMPEFVRSK